MKYILIILIIYFITPSLKANSCLDMFLGKSSTYISQDSLNEIFSIYKREKIKVPNPKHRTSILLQKDSTGTPIKTSKVILIFHGLLNSPQWMRSFENQAQESGFNVVNVRLENHQELNRHALDQATYSQWLHQSDRFFQLAKDLGEEVVIVGHSTGGVLATSLAFTYPDTIKNVLLLSPAFNLSTQLRLFLKSSTYIHFTGKHLESILQFEFKKYLSTFAGIEVIKLGQWFKEKMDFAINNQFQFLENSLQSKLRFQIVDSAKDIVVDPDANRHFHNSLLTYHEFFESSYTQIPREFRVKHDDVPQSQNEAHESYVLGAFRKLLTNSSLE